MQGSGRPLTGDECLVAAAVCGAFTVYLLLAAYFPSLRFGWVWRGINRPMSGIAFSAWALFVASWVVVLIACGFHYTPVTDYGLWIIGVAFLAVPLALLRDLLVRR